MPEVNEEVSSSLFELLPENRFTDVLYEINNIMSDVVSDYIVETPLTSFFIQNPLFVLIIFFVVMIVISLFLNFIHDAWKIPIAVIVDILGLIAMQQVFGLLTIITMAGGFLFFFIFFHDMEKLKYVFGIICAVKPVLPIPMLNMFPINTIFAFIAAFLTR